jgi:molecular chaperone GrpE (heat shock protein)
MLMMQDTQQLKVSKWPFFLGDSVMLCMAYFIFWQGGNPLAQWEVVACAICVALGALLGVLPFLLEYRSVLKVIETSAVGSAAEKIQNLQAVSGQISNAANLWENAQQQAEMTTNAAKEISERMNAELQDFKQFLEKANEGERATLRLEVDKLRRAEADWLQVLVHIFDHIFALCAAAERSGQQQLISQLNQFQNACRDTVRRIGLMPYVGKLSDPFDPNRHKWADGEIPPPGSTVAETVASGYTYQGKIVRLALVRVQKDADFETQPELPGESDAPAPSPVPAEATDS